MAKKIISYIISFLLVIILIVFTLLQTVKLTILNKSYVENKINNSNYYTELSETINEKFKNYIMQSGMEETIFENLFTEETLKNDFENVLDVIYENSELSIDTTKIKNKLDSNIEQYTNENKIKLTATNKQQIAAFEETIIQNYVSSVQYSSSAISYIAKIVQTSNTYIKPALYITTFFAIALIITLILINVKKIKQVFSYIGITLIATGGLIIIGLIFEKTNLNLEHAIILDDTLSILIRLFVSNMVNILYKISIAGIITGMAFIII